MISVNDATRKIREQTKLLTSIHVPVSKALGLVLAENVLAPISVPNFDQSAMDGYAFRFADYIKSKEFTVSGEVAAGDGPPPDILPFHAVRIFTGAIVPPLVDTVVMQEKTERNKEKLIVLDDQLQQGSNVRKTGQEISSGELALAKGTYLTPAAIGFLAGIGITRVKVYPKPLVHLIITGKELILPGQPLQPGQVYESNSVMLQSALEQMHISNVTIHFAGDDRKETADAIRLAQKTADLLLMTGGVSVGSYDFVVQAAGDCGFQQLFHKVAQRPGKPLYVGCKEGKMLFGLPGNPASVLTCFYQYVVTAIEEMTGRKNILERKQVPLLTDINKKIDFTQFLKAYCTLEGVKPLSAQESFRLSSFSAANCLLVLPEEKREYACGEKVDILCLPYL